MPSAAFQFGDHLPDLLLMAAMRDQRCVLSVYHQHILEAERDDEMFFTGVDNQAA